MEEEDGREFLILPAGGPEIGNPAGHFGGQGSEPWQNHPTPGMGRESNGENFLSLNGTNNKMVLLKKAGSACWSEVLSDQNPSSESPGR